jgi:hypothetical protein
LRAPEAAGLRAVTVGHTKVGFSSQPDRAVHPQGRLSKPVALTGKGGTLLNLYILTEAS